MSLLAFSGPDEEVEAQRAGLLSSALFASGRPLIDKINGAGLLSPDHVGPKHLSEPRHEYLPPPGMGTVRPFIAANSDILSMEPRSIISLSESPDLMATVQEMLGASPDWLGSVLVWALPSPRPQVNLGAKIIQAQSGTAGFSLSWTGETAT